MEKYIISDLHGNGIIYQTIMNYLENKNKEKEIILYINGDLIDRGKDSGDLLLDIMNKNQSFPVIYLGGNHELLMYQFFRDDRNGNYKYWYMNGGKVTHTRLKEICKETNKPITEFVDYISNLNIYHKFKEEINHKKIVLVHAGCPRIVEDECHMKIQDNEEIDFYVWVRENDPIYRRCFIGNKDYFTIIGHTPNLNKEGFSYNKQENYLNIDGGSSYYIEGYHEYNHIPLVQIEDGYIKIIIFNHNNEIINAYYFDGTHTTPYTIEELQKERSYLKESKTLLNKNII